MRLTDIIVPPPGPLTLLHEAAVVSLGREEADRVLAVVRAVRVPWGVRLAAMGRL